MKKTVLTCAMAVGALGLAMSAPVALAYQGGAVSNGGKVTGKVSFKGTAPAPRQVAITKDNAVCGTGTREIAEVAVKDGALQNAVVYVTKIEQGKEWGAMAVPVVDQKGCKFAPDVTIVSKGGELVARNSDPVLHNIHTYEIIGKVRRSMFNVSQPNPGDTKQAMATKRGFAIKIECDAHDFMHAWAFAAENPYAVATAADGSFSLDDIPAGEYELKAWHPILGEQSAKVTVAAGGSATAAFEFAQ